MANKSRFAIAQGSIKSFFKSNSLKIYSLPQLNGIFEENRIAWNLPNSMNSEKFIDRLIKAEILRKVAFNFSGYYGSKDRYIATETNPTIFELATSIVNKGYLSHYSAVFIHGLTTQVPKIVYVTFEQAKKSYKPNKLKQSAVDTAFSKPQRTSNSFIIYEGFTIMVLNGKYTNRAGVYIAEKIPLTNIERTLIDIAVRPDYAGGVAAVLETYRNAIGKFSINKLTAILDKLEFIYPYHQAIGFYLQQAGVEAKKLKVKAFGETNPVADNSSESGRVLNRRVEFKKK